MLNWIIKKMDDKGIFEHSTLQAISTCFCCADKEEQKKIQHRGRSIPVTAVVNYIGAKVDVITPRDLLFDGMVVEANGKLGRLPVIFMNLKKLFDIKADKEQDFLEEVKELNQKFIKRIEKKFKVKVSLDWFGDLKDPIIKVTNCAPNENMKKVMEKIPALQK